MSTTPGASLARIEIDSVERLSAWLAAPGTGPAIFHDLDLRDVADRIIEHGIEGCSFFGCRLGARLADAADVSGCVVLHASRGLPFDPFRGSLYTPDELYAGFEPAVPGSYRACPDAVIYDSFMERSPSGGSGRQRHVDQEITLMRRLHDASIADALDDLLDAETRRRCVAVLGGHDVGRRAPLYREIAELGQRLAGLGYLVMTGGGPGLMEAANLGAYTAGFADPVDALAVALDGLSGADTHDDPRWVNTAWEVRRRLGPPEVPASSRSVGIPTWFYGHEPPNMFATDIAKYFENSIREEGLLAVALGGAIFAAGNAGTVQEIFQDACQNYYRTYESVKSPMVLLGSEYWNPGSSVVDEAGSRSPKPLYGLLRVLAAERGFDDYVLLTDDTDEIVRFIIEHPPAGPPS